MCHKYHVKHILKQCKLDRLKSGSKRDTNETPTCAVPMHAPQTNALWWGEEEGTTKALLYTLPRCVVTADWLIHLSYSGATKISQCGTPDQFLKKIASLCISSQKKYLFNLEVNGPEVVAGCCTHFPQLLAWVWEGKKNLDVGTDRPIMEKSHSCWPRTIWCVVNMFHRNEMRPLIIANGTKCYSILYCNSPWLYIRLKYTYSVTSVKLDWLPGNSKKWTIDLFVAFGVRLVHSWAACEIGKGF